MSSTSTPKAAELSELDDLPIHQHADVLARPASERWNWTERWYFNLQKPNGEIVGIIGGGVFRNTGVTESYFCVQDGDSQYNHRTTRPLEKSPLSDGFVQFEIVDPMKSWRVAAADEHCNIAVNLNFEASASPFLFKPFWVGPDRDAPDYDQYEHFVQPGTFTGLVKAHGVNLHNGTALSFRDRTWGVRSRRPRLHNWIVLHFDDSSYMTLVHQETATGRVLFTHAGLVHSDGEVELFEIESHSIRFEPISRIPQEGTFELFAPGRKVTLEMSALGESIRGLGAGYDPLQGTSRGNSPDMVCSTWDIKDPVIIEKIGRGTIDTGVQVSLSGSSLRLNGIGCWETALGRSHYRYGQQIAELDRDT